MENRKNFIKKLNELLKNNECVYSKLLGRTCKVIGYDEENNWLKVELNGKKFNITYIDNGCQLQLKQENDCWVITENIEKM